MQSVCQVAACEKKAKEQQISCLYVCKNMTAAAVGIQLKQTCGDEKQAAVNTEGSFGHSAASHFFEQVFFPVHSRHGPLR